MKKVWLLFLLVFLTGCGVQGPQPTCGPDGPPPSEAELSFGGTVFTAAEEIYAVDRAETYPETPGEPAEIYDSLDALTEAADEIVLGYARSVVKKGTEITTDFMTTENWKGSVREGLSFTVLEETGIAPMEPDGTYLLFLQGEYPEYRLCGAVQGRFVEHCGYLFQQTWESLKLPDTPARTATLANAVSRLQPMPTCGPYGPPWIWSFEDVYAVQAFIKAAEAPETCARWIEENGAVHSGLLSDVERAAAIAASLRDLPLPTLAAARGLPVEVYPDSDWRDVDLTDTDGEKRWSMTIGLDTETVEAGPYGRPVEAEAFTVLFDQTDVLSASEDYHFYTGQVANRRVSLRLWGYTGEEARYFLEELRFWTPGERK